MSTARCVRCGSEPMPRVLFCERCWSIVELEALNVDRAPVQSPFVKRAIKRELQGKVVR